MDIFFVKQRPPVIFGLRQGRSANALYKNIGMGRSPTSPEKAGVTGAYFGMGAAVGDYDNDGWPTFSLLHMGNAFSTKNDHDGTFTDVTEKAGVATPGSTIQRRFGFDYDNDGRLDLFVCSFVDYSGAQTRMREYQIGRNYYCVPRVFKPTASFLYHKTMATVLSLK